MVAKAVLRKMASAFFGNQISVVYTPYKVGSTTLFDRLCEPRFSAGGHIQTINDVPPPVVHFTVKCHSGDTSLAEVRERVQRPFERILTLVRPVSEIYVSAFFQNICDPEYDYHYGTRDDVLCASTKSLVDHFMSIQWSSHRHLQPSYNAKSINDYCGVDYSGDFLRDTSDGFRVYHGNSNDGDVMVAVAMMDVLRRRDRFRKFIGSLRLPVHFRLRRISMSRSNLSASKWYSDKHRALMSHPTIEKLLAEKREEAC